MDGPFDCVIYNGQVVSAADSGYYDIGIKDGKIALLAPALSLKAAPTRRAIDAQGAMVTPGGVDAHVHLAEPELFGKGRSADDYESGKNSRALLTSRGWQQPAPERQILIDAGTRSAVAGGTTTVITFAPQPKSSPSGLAAIDEAQAKAAGRAYCDYALHLLMTNPCRRALDEFATLRERGVSRAATA
ncbi:hypothetical protein VTK73DRAFT_4535 [Phialemonium thermophilum]|uniref:Amidohydrolase-related domain-containing protein n=1 Tax=Phialemonium thermophilum TaxID=223376 RepID=A0ABR3V9N8_9PEZI